MKKSLFPHLALMAVLMVFVSACSKKSEYTNVIPANATVVASINMKSLADKAGLNDKENKEAKQKLIDALKDGMNAATFQQVEMILKDSQKSEIGNRHIGTHIYFQFRVISLLLCGSQSYQRR